MIINPNVILAIAAVAGCAAAYAFIKKTGTTIKEAWRISLVILFAVGALFYWGIESLATEVVILEGETEWNYTHESVLMYGSAELELSNGEVIDTKGLGLKLSKTYCFNCTNSGMLFYATVYTPSEGVFYFNSSKNIEVPESHYIDNGCYDEITAEPEFWFREAPQSVEVSEGFIEQLWNSIFNIGDIRWTVIPYVIEEE